VLIRKKLTFLLLLAMSVTAFAQELPTVDKMKTSAGNVEIYCIGHGSLMFTFNEIVVQIDPVRSSGKYDSFPKADLILVTHEHGDHLDTRLLEDIKKDGTIMFCNKASALKVPWAKAMVAGDKQDFKNIKIEAVEAYNIVNERAPGQPFHPKGSGLGFIITFGDTRFYIAGDTENTPEMKALKGIDVAFLPMNLPYTMTPSMVADASMAFKPRILYPYHYGDTDTGELVKLLNGTNITILIRNLK
jgi:L-ascorbate metabolism protein UlaG (beta-lactamase superfamily)